MGKTTKTEPTEISLAGMPHNLTIDEAAEWIENEVRRVLEERRNKNV